MARIIVAYDSRVEIEAGNGTVVNITKTMMVVPGSETWNPPFKGDDRQGFMADPEYTHSL